MFKASAFTPFHFTLTAPLRIVNVSLKLKDKMNIVWQSNYEEHKPSCIIVWEYLFTGIIYLSLFSVHFEQILT